MSAITLGNIGQLPKASKPVLDENYRALNAELTRLRAALPRLWEKLEEPKRAELYHLALNGLVARPGPFQMLRVLPQALMTSIRLQRTGQFGDFLEYSRLLSLLWNDVLSLSENDNLAFQRDARAAIELARKTEPVAPMRTRAEIDEWLSNLV